MTRAGIGFLLRAGALAAALVVVLGSNAGRAQNAGPAKKAAPTDDQLKEQLLAFNTAKTDAAQLEKLRAFVKDKAAAKRGVALAARMQKDAKGADRPFTYTGALMVAKAAHFVRDYPTAETFYDYCADTATKLESGEKMLLAYDGLLDLYWATRRYADAADLCEKVVETKGPPEVMAAAGYFLEKLIQSKALQGNTKEALRITESLMQLEDRKWPLIQLRGWVYREAGKYPEAIEAYQTALDQAAADRRLKGPQKDRELDRMRYLLSNLFVDNGEIDKAAEQLQTLIKKNPENPTYKNDLGFIWADRDLNLDEAEKLIREALDLDKKRQEKALADGKIDEIRESAAYLDSLGWVLFKKKDYKAALPYLKKAAADEDEGEHLEIWDHVADCELALGNKAAAVAAWQKGLTFEDISKRDAARRARMIEKLRAQGAEPPPNAKTSPTPMPKRKID
jgi:tetratricopeptide (TPR) repeat protein